MHVDNNTNKTNTSISQDSACSERDGCCQTMLPINFQGFSVDFKEEGGRQGRKYAFLRSDFTGLYDLRLNETVPVVLEWGIANDTNYALDLIRQDYDAIYNSSDNSPFGYGRYDIDNCETLFMQCYCKQGYGGNPYLIGGCQDINECEDPNRCSGTCVNEQGSFHCVGGRKTAKFILIGVGAGLGVLLLCLVLWGLYKYIKKRKEIKLREKYFKRNDGLLLESELSSAEGNIEKNKRI